MAVYTEVKRSSRFDELTPNCRPLLSISATEIPFTSMGNLNLTVNSRRVFDFIASHSALWDHILPFVVLTSFLNLITAFLT